MICPERADQRRPSLCRRREEVRSVSETLYQKKRTGC